MALRTAIIAASLLATFAAARSQEEARPAPPLAPTLLSPPDDPDERDCLAPDPQDGIKLAWKTNGDASGTDAYPVSSYIEIRRKDPATGDWRNWVRKYANPPFTLFVRSPRAYNALFAWRIWAVDRTGQAQPYATPSGWWVFCTSSPAEAPG